MQHFNIGDMVIVVNSVYNPELPGHAGTVRHSEDHFSGYDKYGCFVSGKFVVVELPDDINRFGTTLWYLKPEHLVKIRSGDKVMEEIHHAKADFDINESGKI